MSRTPTIRRPVVRLVSAVCAALLVVPALGRPAVQADAQSRQFPAAGEPAIVTVLTPGAEPRRELRYRIASGQSMAMEMSTLMSVTMDMGGMVMPTAQLPKMVMGADLAVTDVSASGDVTYAMTFTKADMEDTPGVDAAMLAAMRQMESGMVGISGTATVSTRGVVRSAEMDLSRVTDPQLLQSMEPMSAQMEQFSMPFPVEAVGVGARWEVRYRLEQNAISTTQLMTMEVTAIEGDVVTMAATVEQAAANQVIANPDLPPGATMRLRSLTGRGTGTMVVDLTSLIPTSDVSITSNAVMDIDMGGDSQAMGVETKMVVTVRGTGSR